MRRTSEGEPLNDSRSASNSSTRVKPARAIASSFSSSVPLRQTVAMAVFIVPPIAGHGYGAAMKKKTGGKNAGSRRRRKRNNVEVATHEFARKGYGGARVDAIAARTRTSKRMLYYYFGDKEGLYLAVLEQVYGAIRRAESTLDLEHRQPRDALARLVGFTFDYYNDHPEFVRLVMNENIMDGVHMKRSRTIAKLNVTVIDALRRIVARGHKDGVFRKGIDPIELHMSISALGIFNVANRATFSTIFGRDMASPRARAERRRQIVDIIWRHVAAI